MPGTGVVISAGVYLKLIGKIFEARGALCKDLLKGRIARPLVVVHSGKMTITRPALCCINWSSLTN